MVYAGGGPRDRSRTKMTGKDKASPEWEAQAVVKRLRKTTSPGRPSAVQVFLNENVSASELPEKAKEIVTEASESLKLPTGSIKLGKVFRSANSFSVSSDVPDVFDEIAKRSE